MQRTRQEEELLAANYQHELVEQLVNAGITQLPVLNAFRCVPRHKYVTEWYERGSAQTLYERGTWQLYLLEGMGKEQYLARVYQDQPLVTRIDANDAPASSSSQPSLMAEMLEILQPQAGHQVWRLREHTWHWA